MASLMDGSYTVVNDLTVGGTFTANVRRTSLVQEDLAKFVLPLTEFRVWDAMQTVLPGTAASDDLGVSWGTWATHSGKITAGDLKAAGATTRRCRIMTHLPENYVSGETVLIRIRCGMETTVADTSCTVDAEAYINGRDGTIDGSDLVTTAATTMNSLTFGDKDFTVTPTSLVAGDELDIRISITCTDGATGTTVQPSIGQVAIMADVKG